MLNRLCLLASVSLSSGFWLPYPKHSPSSHARAASVSAYEDSFDSAWGRKIVHVAYVDEGAHVDITPELLNKTSTDISAIRQGYAFFELNTAQGNPCALAIGGSSLAHRDSLAKGAVVGTAITLGRLARPEDNQEARIWLMSLAGAKGKSTGAKASVAVTWNGLKTEPGSSHRCAVREDEVSLERKTALDKALAELEVDVLELLNSEQLTGSGSSAARSYTSFVQPRQGRNQASLDIALDQSVRRTASQISFFVRAYRAEQASYLRNRDAAMQQFESCRAQVHPLVLVLDNVRSSYNVGSIFRTSETALISEVITCGITPHPPHAKLEKTACRSVLNVPTRHFSATGEALQDLKSKGFSIYAMETTDRSQCYTNVDYPQPTALVLGNEVTGVDSCILEQCDRLVEIPTFGQKNSLNVASAAPVVVFEVLRKWGAFVGR